MGRPRIYDDRTAFYVRLPKGTLDRLRKAAAERDVSVNLLVQSAVDAHLAGLPSVDEALGVKS